MTLPHLASLTSYGFPYLYPFCSGAIDQDAGLRDSLLRLPHGLLRKPVFVRPDARGAHKKEGA